MDAVELLRKMNAACSVKCHCGIEFDLSESLILRWSGRVKINKNGDEKAWSQSVAITPFQLRQPSCLNYLEIILRDSGETINRLLADIADEAKP